MRKVNHENIYKMYDAFQDSNNFYLIVELLSKPIHKVYLFSIKIFKGMV